MGKEKGLERRVWERACLLFERSLALEPESRAAFLESTCPDDEEVRTTVERMLAADRAPFNALDRLAAEVARLRADPSIRPGSEADP